MDYSLTDEQNMFTLLECSIHDERLLVRFIGSKPPILK